MSCLITIAIITTIILSILSAMIWLDELFYVFKPKCLEIKIHKLLAWWFYISTSIGFILFVYFVHLGVEKCLQK